MVGGEAERRGGEEEEDESGKREGLRGLVRWNPY